MKLNELKKKLKQYPYVTGAFFLEQGVTPKTLKNQLVKWVATGEIIRLKEGLYTLSNDDRKVGLSHELIANILYYPSYISLEYALAYYHMIPEGVFSVTSISPKKTQKFTNPFGLFIYKNMKRAAFFGYNMVKDHFGQNVLIATPEKALLDYLYLKAPVGVEIGDLYFDELRLQNTEEINDKKLVEMAEKFGSKKLMNIVHAFLEWRKGE